MTRTVAISAGARRYALVILAIVYMFNFIDRQILAILLPQFWRKLSLGYFWLSRRTIVLTIVTIAVATVFGVFFIWSRSLVLAQISAY